MAEESSANGWPPSAEAAGDAWAPAADESTDIWSSTQLQDQSAPIDNSAPVASEPFWRSESWLLEPVSEEAQAVEYLPDTFPEPETQEAAGVSEPAYDTPPPPEQWNPAPSPVVASESAKWDELYDAASPNWSSYERELDTPVLDVPPRDTPDGVATNASGFAAQRSAAVVDDPPTQGFPKFVHRASFGGIKMRPTKEERQRRDAIRDIRRSIAGLRQITFTNPKGGSGKTTAALLTSMTLGQLRGGYILAWDNNETQGTLGVRARPDHHANTVRDLVANLPSFSGPVPGRVGDLAQFVRSQGDAMFDVLASDEQAEAGEMMTAAAFQAVREVVGRFYKLICVDTGNNVRAANWAASIDSTDQLVVTSSVRWESAYSASRMLDYLEQSGRGDLVANAVTVLVMPRSMKGLNLPQVETHFKLRTREVLFVPFDPQLDNGDEIRFKSLSEETRQAWLDISAAIARGL